MFHCLPAGTVLYRVTDLMRNWQDVISGTGAYFNSGGRYNRVHQRTIYASRDPLVSIAECAVHEAIDRLQPRIGGGFLSGPILFAAPPTPFISVHRLWSFTIDADMHLVDLDHPTARATFHHRLYELRNPCVAYRTTATLADAIRLHPHPMAANAMADGVWAPSVRTPRVGGDRPRQAVLFVPPNQLTISATQVNCWRMELEFGDRTSQSAGPNTSEIDWPNPWFRLSQNAAAIPAFAPRPAFAPAAWHQFRVKYT